MITQIDISGFRSIKQQSIPQQVNDKGQIEGGLMNFMEAELSNLKSLLGI